MIGNCSRIARARRAAASVGDIRLGFKLFEVLRVDHPARQVQGEPRAGEGGEILQALSLALNLGTEGAEAFAPGEGQAGGQVGIGGVLRERGQGRC